MYLNDFIVIFIFTFTHYSKILHADWPVGIVSES